MKIALFVRAQFGSSASPATERIEDEIRAIDLHLIHHLKQFAETTLWPARLIGKPREVFGWQIVDGQAFWRKVGGTKFAEGHVGPSDGFEISPHGFLHRRLSGFRLGRFIGHFHAV